MKTTWGVLIAVMMLAVCGLATSQTAVIETNHHAFYNPANHNGFTMTEGYAPLPVFFEGWKSTPHADMADWKWNFGDGTAEFHGFNAAHVFESPGTYTVTLTVTTNGGQSASTTTTVTVHPRDGTTYYVDAEIGDDANDGLTPETAWRTGTHAFLGMTNNRYSPGDEILFKRGQTFEIHGGRQVTIGHNKAGWGYRFATYGEGPKPILKNSGIETSEFIYQIGINAIRITIQDLEINMENASGDRISNFWDVREQSHNLLFWRLNFYDVNAVVNLNGHPTDYQISNVFIHDCSVSRSNRIMFFTRLTRLSMIGNIFDWAENHIHYGSWIDTGIIADNIHSRPAWGRTALRISGKSDDFNMPSQNIHVIRNYFGGHMDPLVSTDPADSTHYKEPTRYNYQMVYLAPNKRSVQRMSNVIFEKNVVTNCEQAIIAGGYDDLIIRDNLILTVDHYGDAPRLTLGHKYEMKPLNNVKVINNTFVTNQVRIGNAGAISIMPYDDIEYNGQTEHSNVTITGNKFYPMGSDNPMIWYDFSRHSVYKDDATAGHAQLMVLNQQVTIDDNQYFKPDASKHGYAGGYWNTPSTTGTIYDLNGWQSQYGQSANAVYLPQGNGPYPGQAYSRPTTYAGTVLVEFDEALDANRNPAPQVYLWVKVGNGNWQDANLPPLPGPAGTFTYNPPSPGRYYFATVSVDSQGVESIHPNQLPTPFANTWTTVYSIDGELPQEDVPPPPEPDETAPTAGTASSPASTYSSPITVTYSGAQDESGGSGVSLVRLWVKQGSGGTWTDTGLTSTGTSGGFSYAAPGFGTYYFAVQAEDNSGNVSPAPSGDGDSITVYEEPAAGIMAHLKFDDSPTDDIADDSSGLGNDGQMTDSTRPAQASGQIDGAYDFSSDRVTLSTLDVPGSALTIAAWINGSEYTNTFRRIVQKATGIQSDATWWGIGTQNPANNIRFQLRTADGVVANLNSDTVLSPGVWYHVAGVYDGTVMRLYINGVEDTSMVKSGQVATDSSVETWVGDCPPLGGRPFPGLIDDVRIYNTALSVTEVEELALLTQPEPDPVDSTAPNPGALSGPAMSNSWPMELTYAGATDDDSGLKSVTLWARKGGGAWTNTGLSQTTASGVFSYTGTGDDTYFFAIQAEDNAGNISAAPSGDGQGSSIYDTSAPSTGVVTVSQYSTNPVTIDYADVTDASGGTGLAEVQLWAKQGTGSWTNTGLTDTLAAGSFVWNGATSDATYNFAIRSADVVGNQSIEPSGSGQASTTVDSTAPTPGVVSTQSSTATSTPINLDYSGASDSGAGIEEVQLWFKKGAGGIWKNSGLTQQGASGSFAFSGVGEDKHYYFGLRVKDAAGNLSTAPSGAGDTSVRYDTTPPAKGALSVPGSNVSSSPVQIDYDGVIDLLGTVQEVRLFVKANNSWSDTGDTRSTETGSFSYTPSQPGTYSFDLVVKDDLGNTSPDPTGDGLATTEFDATAPIAGTLTGPESATEGPVDLNYSGASDADSGLEKVTLWVKKPGSSWVATLQTSTTESGTFSYNDFTSDGTYCFAIQAKDNAGNESAAPSGDGAVQLTYDGTAPTPPTVTAPESTKESPITIEYVGGSDSSSGFKEARLWSRKGTGAWADTGQLSPNATGSFEFSAFTGDDTYYFAVQVEDNAGNSSADPTGDGQAQTIYDTTGPATGTADAPEYASEVPINVNYTSSAGVEKAYLWFKKDAGAWTKSTHQATGESGSFPFNGVTGDGTYSFAVQTEDSLGNTSDDPTSDGSASTTFDSAKPTVPALSATSPTGSSPIAITYSGASDATSGVSEVALWFKKGSAGAWAAATVGAGTTADGSFDFAGMSGDDTYYFQTVVTDGAGNESDPPTGDGALSVVFDGAAPNAGVASSPEAASTTPITVTYAGAGDDGSGLSEVELWVRQDAGAWAASGLPAQTTESGSFDYTPSADGTYYFALRATDDLGNQSNEPTGDGDTSTDYDSTPPSGVTLTAPSVVNSTPITVQYSGGTDVARVELYYKKGSAGSWQQSSAAATGSSGSVNFTEASGDGMYAFDMVAFDDMDNPTDTPTGAGSASTTLDTQAPTVGTITAPPEASGGTIDLTYSGVSDAGSGVAEVALWAKKGSGGAWAATGQTATGESGAFSYAGVSGDDTYFFAIVATDEADNASGEPAGDGLASTVYDAGAPQNGTMSAPEVASSGPIEVTYSGVSDNGSGLAEVSLWVRKGPGAWSPTGLTSTGESGSFSYTDITGDTTYYFAMTAEDNAGNTSDNPTGDGLASTLIDTTAPLAATVTVGEYASDAPINVNYSSSDAAGSGFKAAHGWVRKDAGAWSLAESPLAAESGAWAFSGMSGDGNYHFYIQIEDNAGNKSADPVADGGGSTLYDSIAPSTGTLTVNGENTTSNPISVGYSGVNDATSGVKLIELWAKPPSGVWGSTGATAIGSAGTLSYTANSGEGQYAFGLVVEDEAGNRSPDPAGDGAVQITYDASAPEIGTMDAPEFASAAPITLNYSGVSDGGTGIESVQLYVRKDNGAWAPANPEVTSTGESGSMSYTPSAGDGTYYFGLRAKDASGNESAVPTGSGLATVKFDTTAPATGIVTAPKFASEIPVNISYSGASDVGSGTDTVKLFVKAADGPWTDTGLTSEGSSGSFAFSAFTDEGSYSFGVQVTDNAGQSSPEPTGEGQATMMFDNTAPAIGTLEAPPNEDSAPISIVYSGTTDGGSGVDRAYLWFKKGTGGVWTDSGEISIGDAGSFSFTGITEDDTYFFAIVVEDKAGNKSDDPAGSGQDSTVVDTSFTAGAATAEPYSNSLPITVTFDGAAAPEGQTVQVYLWVKQGVDGAWAQTSLPPVSGSNGQFQYDAITEEDTYFFAVRAENSNGDLSTEPFGNGDTSVIYDTTAPNPILLATPVAANQSPITIEYQGEEDTLSGLKQVKIWMKAGIEGIWEQTDLIQSGTEGSFDYEGITEEGIYFFYLQMVDNAGNESPVPTDETVFAPSETT